MARATFNALQAILIRERLILYFDHRRLTDKSFSVRKLIETVVFSEANAEKPTAYHAADDTGERYDAGLPLKNNTIGNLLTRKASATTDATQPLLCDFLVSEGFLSPRLLVMSARHPHKPLTTQFSGIAATDPRLQKYRYALEGEYLLVTQNAVHQLWIAAPGRSKPFVTLRTTAANSSNVSAPDRMPLKNVNHDSATPSTLHEGRIYLMPDESPTLVEVSYADRTWDGRIQRVLANDDALILHNDAYADIILKRLSPINCMTSRRNRYSVADGVRAAEFANTKKEEGIFAAIVRAKERETMTNAQQQPEAQNQQNLNSRLIESAKAGDATAVLRALLDGANINAKDPELGRTATHWAAAANALEAVLILAVHDDVETEMMAKHLPSMNFDEESLLGWRAARASRDPLVVDDREHCYPSAFAPVAFDGGERGRRATAIWQCLMRIEMETRQSRAESGPYSHLEDWKPSSVMQEASILYNPPLPKGYSLPKPSPDFE